MSATILSINIEFILSGAQFETALRKGLAEQPNIACLQEALDHRDPIIERVCADLGYAWARAKGGEPILWKITRHGKAPRSVKPVLLARAELVGHLPGRKDRLPASIATEVTLDDLASTRPGGDVVVAIDYHLTAEIQDVRGGGGYKKDLKHRLRVMRHKREKWRLGRRGRLHQRLGHEAYLCGDGNFAGMVIRSFVNCWEGHDGPPHGTLGGRPVDIVFNDRKPLRLSTLPTASDHDALVCVYK